MTKKLPSIDDIVTIDTSGEWPTKSGGTLSVLFKLDAATLDRFLSYDPEELTALPRDIRGLRSYKVEGIPLGSIGANEWHKVRNELVFCLNGTLRWICKDTYGNSKDFTITKGVAILSPHHILHSYEALEDNSCIAVLANTLFDPNDPSTHDAYPVEHFPTTG